MGITSWIATALNPANYIGGVHFKPDLDIQDLSGKVILVTGGNTGLGKETIRQILKHNPSKVFLAACSEEKATQAIQELTSASPPSLLPPTTTLTWLPLDLTKTESIKAAVNAFNTHSSRLDILILNAGIFDSAPASKTDIGHEIHLGTNHTGHFLLTKLLLPSLLRTATETDSDVRVISVASMAYTLSPSFDIILDQEKLSEQGSAARYGASKVANILFASELARRYPALMSVSVHPGVIYTGLYRSYDSGERGSLVGAALRGVLERVGSSVEAGARNQVWAAVGAKRKELVNGGHCVPVGNWKERNRYVREEEMGRMLWEWTEREGRRAGII